MTPFQFQCLVLIGPEMLSCSTQSALESWWWMEAAMPKPRQKTKVGNHTGDYAAALSTEKRLMGLFHETERDGI